MSISSSQGRLRDPQSPIFDLTSPRTGASPGNGCTVHTTSAHSFGVLEALTIIAACSEASEAIDLLNSIRIIATGILWLPVGPGAEGMARRMGQILRNRQWIASARTTYNDAATKYLAHHFFQWCVRCVPTHSPDPFMDETWLPRVRILLSLDTGLRLLADSLVNRFQLPDNKEMAVEAPVASAPSMTTTAPAPAVSVPSPSPDAIYTRLIARLRVVVRAKRFVDQFVRHWNAQKARTAALASAPAPTVASSDELQREHDMPPRSQVMRSVPRRTIRRPRSSLRAMTSSTMSQYYRMGSMTSYSSMQNRHPLQFRKMLGQPHRHIYFRKSAHSDLSRHSRGASILGDHRARLVPRPILYPSFALPVRQ